MAAQLHSAGPIDVCSNAEVTVVEAARCQRIVDEWKHSSFGKPAREAVLVSIRLAGRVAMKIAPGANLG